MREVIWSEAFSRQVEAAGGARLVDEALTPILDGLWRNPYGFYKFENDHVSFRYVKTDPISGKLGALTVIFTIDAKKNVILEWFDEELIF